MRITIFDTETTGLPRREAGLDEQPHIIQFASVTYDFDPLTRRFTEQGRYNQLIKPPVPVPAESTRISRITDQSVANAPTFSEVEPRIRDIFSRSDLAIAHNLGFDQEMLQNELQRMGQLGRILPINTFDTLEGTRSLCKLPGKNGNYKAPRLMELYQFLFNERFEEAHDAEKDVDALARCVKMLLQEGVYKPSITNEKSRSLQEEKVEQASLF